MGLFHVSSPPTSLKMALLYVLSCRIPVQLHIRQFSVMMIIMWFSCNFETVMRGDKHSIYLNHHLDQKPKAVLFSSSLSFTPKTGLKISVVCTRGDHVTFLTSYVVMHRCLWNESSSLRKLF